MEEREAPRDEDDTARKHYVLSSSKGSPSIVKQHFSFRGGANKIEEGGIVSDVDMELSPAAQRRYI